ncbi:MAG: DNA repair protein RecO [Candidatus Omnitrophica bacterium]|nr:DNA repair protein RecO [Candidatus Omnitrophota bacterium]
MSIQKTEAIVMRKSEFRETSLIVNFYTRDFGKLSGLLKGIRKEPVKFASNVEPFSFNEIIFYRKTKSDLHLVSQADMRDNFDGLRRDLGKVTQASYMMDLVGALMPLEDKNEAVFALLLDCLNELKGNCNPDKIMTIFKIKMLSLSGFQPHFDSCVSCGDRVMSQSKFSLTLGGLLCPRCFSKDPASRMIFRGTVATVLHIEKNDFRTNLNLGINPQIKKELEIILNAFLNFHLEKELKSQKVLNKLDEIVGVK